MPGRLNPQSRSEVDTIRSVQGKVSAGALARQEKKAKQKPQAVDHLEGHTFRAEDSRLRQKNGTFAKDSVPKHKRVIKRPG